MKKILFVLFFVCAAAFAQDDPIGQQLFPPDLIMAQSQKIHLDDKQRAAIKSEVHSAQSKFIDLQWDLKEAGETMAQMLQQTPIDEHRVLAQADTVMGLEHQIKKIQLTMLIRIKNALTPEQIAQLRQLRNAH